MKIHLVTIGKPKLEYAKQGWDEYVGRLQRMHELRITQLNDKYAYDTKKLIEAGQGTYIVALAIDGSQFSSPQLANFLNERELASREVSFIIGGPEGLPASFLQQANLRWSFSPLTFPHDLAMVVLVEALYRASSINARIPYHK